jgi:hypothetical protein
VRSAVSTAVSKSAPQFITLSLPSATPFFALASLGGAVVDEMIRLVSKRGALAMSVTRPLSAGSRLRSLTSQGVRLSWFQIVHAEFDVEI